MSVKLCVQNKVMTSKNIYFSISQRPAIRIIMKNIETPAPN